jgi:predicted DNA-binding transcriptional regulator AlpA
MSDLLDTNDIMERYKLSSRKTVNNWINSGALPRPMKMGSGPSASNYWRREDILAHETRLAGAAAAPKPAPVVREASVTAADHAPMAAAAARAVAATGALPAGHRADWRTDFTFAAGRVPDDLIAAFGLNAYSSFADLADAVDRKLNPRPPMPAYPGWSEGPCESVERTKHAEAVLAEMRRA